jgi:hypothetical protein
MYVDFPDVRGFASALLDRGIADARAHGAGPVVIVADPTDTPKDIYASMGFRPVALKRTWHKVVGLERPDEAGAFGTKLA